MDRLTAQMTFKAATEGGRRIIRGWATTPRPDRVGDVIMPRGVEYRLPLPLLWQHAHGDPVGKIIGAEVSDDGIRIQGELASGIGKADEAWSMVQAGLVENMSIGFRGIESERMKAGGLRFTKWELLEVSLVTIPANPDARVEVARGAKRLYGVQLSPAIRIIPRVPRGSR